MMMKLIVIVASLLAAPLLVMAQISDCGSILNCADCLSAECASSMRVCMDSCDTADADASCFVAANYRGMDSDEICMIAKETDEAGEIEEMGDDEEGVVEAIVEEVVEEEEETEESETMIDEDEDEQEEIAAGTNTTKPVDDSDAEEIDDSEPDEAAAGANMTMVDDEGTAPDDTAVNSVNAAQNGVTSAASSSLHLWLPTLAGGAIMIASTVSY